LVKTAAKFIFNQSVAIKHRYLLDYLLNEPNVEVCSYINRNGTSIASNLPAPFMRLLRACRFLESKWVLKKNGLKGRVKVLKNVSEIRKDDIVMIYQLFADKCPEMEHVDAFKVVSMIHFHGSQINSDIIKGCKPDVLISESDLKKYSKIFQRYYSWYDKEILVHPFVYEKRFQKLKSVSERKNQVFSTGTITYKKHPEFISVYGNPCDQPMRKYVKEHQKELTGMVDCYNSDYSENANKKMEATGRENKVVHLVKALYYKFFASQQKSYYSFNMVDKFNEYKMCFVGEEILGVPGIGFVEGMACGCAYIGDECGYYEDYGMKERVHYIGYDGTPEDFKAKISYYQQPEQQIELERIAQNGYEYAIENFRGDIVAKNILEQLISIKMRRNNFLDN
jgi:glycosyltransferase involved in cell wall biosynthesis